MNRIILIAFLALAIPQITFAAWWNPISWFKKSDAKIEILENRIKELEASVNSTSTTTQDIKAVPSKDVKVKIIPTINTAVPVEDLEIKLQREILEVKQRIEAQLKIDAERMQTKALPLEQQTQILEEKIQAQTLQIEQQVQTLEEKNLGVDTVDSLIQEYNTKVFAINQQIIDLKNKYYKDIQATQHNSYYSGGYANGLVNRMTDEINIKIEKLNLQIEQLYLYYTIKLNELHYVVPTNNIKPTTPGVKKGGVTAEA